MKLVSVWVASPTMYCVFVLPARPTDGDVQRHLAGRGRRAGARLHDELHQDHDGQREAASEHAHPATHQVLRHQRQGGRVSVQTCCCQREANDVVTSTVLRHAINLLLLTTRISVD